MSDGGWDADDFEPDEPGQKQPVVTDKWDGEDEVDDIKDKWDDEEEEEAKPVDPEMLATQVKKKKPLTARLAEKEAELKRKAEERKKLEDEARRARAAMSAAELAEEKARLLQEQKQADLEMARLAFGDDKKNGEEGGGGVGLDAAQPVSKEDFEQFAVQLKEKICLSQESVHYVLFLETLFRELCLGIDADDVKKLTSTLNVLANEKAKLQKPKASKKKKGGAKASVKSSKDNTLDDYIVDDTPDYDDIF